MIVWHLNFVWRLCFKEDDYKKVEINNFFKVKIYIIVTANNKVPTEYSLVP